jgi:protein O-mannosyl-transferase
MTALSSRSIRWAAPLFVVSCTMAAFLNSLDGEFLMDDYCEILDNPLMESPWPLWRVMLIGHELPSRPLPYLTFALDHALWGKRAFGYHLTNLGIHSIAALALFYLSRTTLLSPRLRETFGSRADMLSALIASLWAVHPLHTQAVTYIYQRLESMTAMLCLISLAMFAGAVARQWNVHWLAGSVLASAAAMFSKETAVVLPFLIASYDWLFCDVPSPLPGRRLRYYTALGSTWLVLFVQMAVQAGRYDPTGVFAGSPLAYFLTQPRVIMHYLRLAFWPTGLCFDLEWPLLRNWVHIIPSLACMAALGVLVVYGLVRRHLWSWLGAAFLLALAPSSSLLPLGAVAVEYRMYLALAAVAATVVLGIDTLIRQTPPGETRRRRLRGAVGLALVAIAVLICLTQNRNRVYATPGGVWLDVIQSGRAGTRAPWNLALACDMYDNFNQAIEYADEVFALNSGLDIYEHLAKRRLRRGDAETAARYLRHAVETQSEEIQKGETVAVRSVAYLVMILKMLGNSAESESLASTYLDRVRATLGEHHPWTREITAIQAGGSASRIETNRRP